MTRRKRKPRVQVDKTYQDERMADGSTAQHQLTISSRAGSHDAQDRSQHYL